MAFKILTQIEQEETPKGKRTVRLNIWGNWIGYVGRKRWMDFGCHASAESDATEWMNQTDTEK